MKFFTILVCYNVPSSGPGVSSQDDPILEDDRADGGSSLRHLGWLVSALGKEGIPLAVLEVEALSRKFLGHEGSHGELLYLKTMGLYNPAGFKILKCSTNNLP